MDGYYPALALVGGAPAGAVLQKLFESKDANVRAAAAETCRHGIFGEATAAALAKLVADPSIKVRRSAIGALAMYANWRYAPAQKALIQLATDKSADPLDRLNATDAIGYAVRLQVKGVRQDPPMFQALVSLLQDKEEPVRSTAAGVLAPLYESAGEGAQRRRAPEGGWEKWLNEITAQYQVMGLPAANRPRLGFPIHVEGCRTRRCPGAGGDGDVVCQRQRRAAELRRGRQMVDQSG